MDIWVEQYIIYKYNPPTGPISIYNAPIENVEAQFQELTTDINTFIIFWMWIV